MQDRFRFRVWNIQEKEMIYNAEIAYDGTTYNTKWQLGKNTNDGWVDCFGYYLDYEHEDYEIMQSTGLKDKNGKLIYEADIVNVPCGNFIIKYCDNCKSFQCFYKDDCFACEGDYHWFELLDDLENLKVIGNIYENKELFNE